MQCTIIRQLIIMRYRKESACILKPFKVNNPRQLRQNCELCESRFQTIINVEHQCKICFRIICEKCAQNKVKIYQPEGHFSVHKCCTLCIKEQNAITSFIKQYKLVFGANSIFSDEWTKKLKKQNISSKDKMSAEQKGNSANIITQFSEKIYQSNNNIIRFKSQSARILSELCASQNYSMRQFTGKLIEQVSTDLFTEKLMQTIIAIYAYLKGMPYTYELVYIVFYLLCFCNEFDCYFIVTRYIEKIFPQYFKIDKNKKDNLLTHELKMIIDMYKILLKKSDKEELDRVVRYLQKDFFATCVKSLLINITNITISFFIVDQIFKNGTYISLYKAIASLIFISKQLLYEEKDETRPTITIQNFILRSITVEQLKAAMIIFQKSNVKFQMDHDFFDSAEHRKLNEKYKQLQSTYQKSQEKYRILDSKHSGLVKDYEQISLKLAQSKKENIAMTEQIIKNAEKFIMIQDIDKYRQENEFLKKRSNHLAEENSLLKKQIQDLRKREMIQKTQNTIFSRIKKDYERQIVDLKTKNEIFQIEKQANDIHFNTSFIEQKLEEKNRAIAQLEDENNKLKIELDFYRNTRINSLPGKEQTLFSVNVSSIQNKNSFTYNQTLTHNNSLNLSGLQITTKEDKDSFKRYIEMGKKVTEKLKSDLSVIQKRNLELEKQVKKLKEEIMKLEKHMELNEEINNFINQIPEDIKYIDSINELEQIIGKQTNIHKKGRLETVLTTFRKCLYEVRYRGIDAKLKQNKIKQLCQPLSTSKLQSRWRKNSIMNESNGFKMLSELNKIDEALDWIGKESQLAEINRSSIKKEECEIM